MPCTNPEPQTLNPRWSVPARLPAIIPPPLPPDPQTIGAPRKNLRGYVGVYIRLVVRATASSSGTPASLRVARHTGMQAHKRPRMSGVPGTLDLLRV